MMIGSPKEVAEGEKRVAMTPDSALQLQKLGFDCVIESGAGADAGFTDAAYEKANVTNTTQNVGPVLRDTHRISAAPGGRRLPLLFRILLLLLDGAWRNGHAKERPERDIGETNKQQMHAQRALCEIHVALAHF